MVHTLHPEGKAQGVMRDYQSFTRRSVEFLFYIAWNIVKNSETVCQPTNSDDESFDIHVTDPVYQRFPRVYQTTGTSPMFTPSVWLEEILYSPCQDWIRPSRYT